MQGAAFAERAAFDPAIADAVASSDRELRVAIAGLVLGIMASRREPYAKPFWLTGILVGAGVVVLAIAAVVFFVVIFATGVVSPY